MAAEDHERAVERIAVISDVHGNLTAFEAVLRHAELRGVTRVLNLGDVVGKGPRGSAAIALSRRRCEVTVRGNWDDFLPRPGQDRDPATQWWHDELSSQDRAWLLDLPLAHHRMISGRRVRFVHASAESVYTRVYRRHTPEEFTGMFGATELTGDGPTPSVVVYGDIHDAYVKTHEGRTLVNVGSAGNPTDGPTPSYVILEGVPNGTSADPFSIQVHRVPYDVEAEIEVARTLRMPALQAYAIELRTGIYRGLHRERGLVSDATAGLTLTE